MPRTRRVCHCTVCKGALAPVDSRKVQTHISTYGLYVEQNTCNGLLKRKFDSEEIEAKR